MAEPNPSAPTGTSTDITIFLVDDQELFRAGLRMVLSSQPDFRVIGEAPDAAGAVRDIPRLRPAVVLMDIRMPGTDGIDATSQVLHACAADAGPLPRILMLTTLDTEDAAHRSLAVGAAGFMLKDTEPEFLIAAVRTLTAGKHVIATGADLGATDSAAQATGGAGAPSQPPAEFGLLTAREREVFAQVAHGLNNREIAGTLFLSEATVKTHLTAILQKLQLRDRVQVVVYAYRHGLAT